MQGVVGQVCEVRVWKVQGMANWVYQVHSVLADQGMAGGKKAVEVQPRVSRREMEVCAQTRADLPAVGVRSQGPGNPATQAKNLQTSQKGPCQLEQGCLPKG